MEGITKSFGGTTANDDISFCLEAGEIHGLLGENGAGKTTLMNILYGLHRPDSGCILVNQVERNITSPHEAIALGIGMVHQHFMQVPTLTVLDNVILGLRNAREPLLDREGARQRLGELSATYQLDVDPEAYIWQLSVGDRQRVEILKALYRDVSILILDEPTSVLTPQEAEELFAMIRVCVNRGMSVIFITHKLEEAMSITDRVTVLRDGRVVATRVTSETTKAELARLMVGREVLFRLSNDAARSPAGPVALEVERLRAISDRGVLAVRDVSFQVHGGEIVGIAGVDGNGQTELVQALTGLRPVESGRVVVDGVDLTNAAPQRILRQGVGHIPEDFDDALVGAFTLVENLALDLHYTPPFSRWGVLNREVMRQSAQQVIARYDVRTPHERVKARTLSGGNKQKVVIARETSRAIKLLIAAHPTRGLDIGAEEYIRGLLLELRNAGIAILLVSTKLDEILSLCDRILVIEKGRLMGEMARSEADIEKIGLLMAGTGA
ncbi:MAG: ABC transporter ATP-binding protein [Anaerolineae bacterium]|nr:ABC transporter ATP-binding protein [Anaerolineae bacterium]